MDRTQPAIQGHPFLRGLVPEHRSVVMLGAEEKAFGAGEIVFREGQPANRFYLIQEGRLTLETHVPGRGDIEIVSAGPGQVLGWSWLVPPYVWHFQARALEPAKAMVLNGGHLLVASEQDHYLGYELMKNISKLILDVLLVAHQRWLDTGHHPVVSVAEEPAAAEAEAGLSMDVRIAEQPFFHGMPPRYLQTLAALAVVKEYEPGQMIFETGHPAEGLYVVERGRLVLEARQAGVSVPVQIIRAGDAVGWSSFCEPYEWQFGARALDLSTTIFFTAAQIRERCAADYHLGYELTKRITRMMLQRLQATRNRMWDAFRSAQIHGPR
jgi:CRP/FNR family transcriptional regulator, cyclic AMP receptor protein